MRTANKKQAIRNAFFRLGLHTTPKCVVDALAQQGVQVDAELVRRVRFEMLRKDTRRATAPPRPVPVSSTRRRPKGFPRRGAYR
jgi:hypothetical protein